MQASAHSNNSSSVSIRFPFQNSKVVEHGSVSTHGDEDVLPDDRNTFASDGSSMLMASDDGSSSGKYAVEEEAVTYELYPHHARPGSGVQNSSSYHQSRGAFETGEYNEEASETARSSKPGYYPVRSIKAFNDMTQTARYRRGKELYNDGQPLMGHNVVCHHANCPPGGFWWCQHCRRHQQGIWPQQLVPQPPGRNGYFTGHEHAAELSQPTRPHTSGGARTRLYHSKEQQLQMKSAEAYPKAGQADLLTGHFVGDDDRTEALSSVAAASTKGVLSIHSRTASQARNGSRRLKKYPTTLRGEAMPDFTKKYPVWHRGPGGQLRCSARGRVYFSRQQAVAEGWEGGLPSVLPDVSNPLTTRQSVMHGSTGKGHYRCGAYDKVLRSVLHCTTPHTCWVCPAGTQVFRADEQDPIAAGLAAACQVEQAEGGQGDDLGLIPDGVATLRKSHKGSSKGNSSNAEQMRVVGDANATTMLRSVTNTLDSSKNVSQAASSHDSTKKKGRQELQLSMYEQRHDFTRREPKWVKAKGDTMAAPTRGRAYFSLAQAQAERWERGLPVPLKTVGGRWQPCARRNGWGEIPVNNF